MTYFFIIDIVLVAVIIITILTSAHRGFISSLIRLLGLIVVLVGAVVVSRVFAPTVFDALFRDNLIDSVAEKLTDVSSLGEAASAIGSGMTGIIVGVFGGEERLADFFANFTFTDSETVATSVVESVIRPSYESLIQAILFVLTAILLSIVIGLVVKLTRVANAIPVVGGLNRILGALFGVLYGVAICYILVAAFAFIFMTIGRANDFDGLVLENTAVFSFLYRSNPILTRTP